MRPLPCWSIVCTNVLPQWSCGNRDAGATGLLSPGGSRVEFEAIGNLVAGASFLFFADFGVGLTSLTTQLVMAAASSSKPSTVS